MSIPVKEKGLVERYSRFVEQGKAKAHDSEAFKKRLDKIAQSSDENRGSKQEHLTESPRHQKKLSGARRHQPPPRMALSSRITIKHAERLSKLAPLIEGAARRNNVPVELICGVILQESGANHKAVSHAGAKGLMQLMPATARRFGVKNVFDPAENIEGGTKYLRWLLDRFDGNVELALAGYNAGEGNVEKYGNKIPPFKETQAYVPSVLSYTQAMIDIFSARIAQNLPQYARKV
ncbi:MAG: lytic transglycosylase domain-containing protein [Proteobacteria bacterium]|nr:lytic transglycosylase domain-containing protein [Pseudomonadota bacterium]